VLLVLGEPERHRVDVFRTRGFAPPQVNLDVGIRRASTYSPVAEMCGIVKVLSFNLRRDETVKSRAGRKCTDSMLI
jgi:hypothetical protein